MDDFGRQQNSECVFEQLFLSVHVTQPTLNMQLCIVENCCNGALSQPFYQPERRQPKPPKMTSPLAPLQSPPRSSDVENEDIKKTSVNVKFV